MNISNVFDVNNVYGMNAVDNVQTEKAATEQKNTTSGDTVSISAEARNFFAQMQSASANTSTETVLENSNGEAMAIEGAESQTLESNSVVASQGTEEQGGNGGGSGGGGGGGSSDEESTSEESLQSEIASVTARLSQARASAEESGDSSQVSALMAELATLEAELSALSA